MLIAKSFLTTAAMMATVVLTAPLSQAAFTYAAGDVLLGFRQSDAGDETIFTSNDFVIKIGTQADFLNRTTPFVLSIAGLDAQLDAIFGNGWETGLNGNGAVTFALFSSSGNPNNNLLISEPANSPAPGRAFSQTGPGGNIFGVGDYYDDSANPSTVANSSVGVTSEAFSFSAQVINSFGSTRLGEIEGSVAGALSLYSVLKAPNSTAAPGTLLGTVTLTNGPSSSQVTFNPVPEPTSAILVGLALGALGLIRRRPARA